jgi:hypothetical protein
MPIVEDLQLHTSLYHIAVLRDDKAFGIRREMQNIVNSHKRGTLVNTNSTIALFTA